MILRMNPLMSNCKILMGCTGNVFVTDQSTQVCALLCKTFCFCDLSIYKAAVKKTLKICFKTKAFIAKNALDMEKKTIKSTTGHQYRTMYNDHMVEHDFNGTKGL